MITRLRYWTRYRTPNVDSGSHAKLNTKTLTYGRCYHATKGRKTVQALLPGEEIYDTASYARVYQHDVRAKQTKVCDAKRAGFHAPIFILVTKAPKPELLRTRPMFHVTARTESELELKRSVLW